MARRWIRQELKKNEVVILIEKVSSIFTGHKQAVLTTFGMIVILLIFSFYVFFRFKNTNIRAWERFAQGQSLIYQGKTEDAIKFMNTFINSFPSTQAAVHASLTLSELQIENNKLDDAVSTLNNALARTQNKLLIPYIYNKLAFSYMQKGNFDQAIEKYNCVVDQNPDHWLTASIFTMLSRCHGLKKNTNNQKEYLERLITLYPGTEWAELASNELKLITKQLN